MAALSDDSKVWASLFVYTWWQRNHLQWLSQTAKSNWELLLISAGLFGGSPKPSPSCASWTWPARLGVPVILISLLFSYRQKSPLFFSPNWHAAFMSILHLILLPVLFYTSNFRCRTSCIMAWKTCYTVANCPWRMLSLKTPQITTRLLTCSSRFPAG